jgi:N-acyl-phosphatidylethanolamine-hydrolysing phospholipase D
MWRGRASSVLLLCAFFWVAAFDGCNPIISRFISSMFDQLGNPVQAVPVKNEHPILPDVTLAVTWIGHASMLIQIHDKVFLTDPVFTRTVGMFAKRVVDPGLDPASISRVDYTLITHLHFDHFSYGSLGMLPKQGVLLLPPGGAAYAPEFGFAETREMTHWGVLEENGVRITAVPAKHFSGRYGFDQMWMEPEGYTGYVIQYRGLTVFVAGDTGYDPELFKKLGKKFQIDLALLPISPIEPRSFMSRVHLDPGEAVRAFEDLGARMMIPMHHRTFVQGFDSSPTYPQELLKKIVKEKGLEDRVLILDIGEQKILFKDSSAAEAMPAKLSGTMLLN